jgi:alpha-ribazole phosphatase
MRIDLLRHGQTGRAGHLDGRTDPPLDEIGWRQFAGQTQGAAWKLVVTSPLARARSAAEDHARRNGCTLRIDDDWAELDFGDWDGGKRSEIAATQDGARRLEAFYADPLNSAAPGGESWIDLQQRVGRAIDAILAEQALEPVLVVTHAGAIRAALSLILGWPLQSLWSLRINPATRIGLEIGRNDRGVWGEIIEIVQP